MTMKRTELHVVIGAGIAGCLSAIARGKAGYQVVMLEREQAVSAGTFPVCTQTSNIVSENHSGAEYPFDPQSARDCMDGRIENQRFFPELIYGGKTYSRIIASQSMIDDGHDIVGQCRTNMKVLREHYAQRCAENPDNAVFGDPADICREIPDVPGVRDVAAAFLTPQRGINPVLVSTVVDWELRQCGVDFRQGSTVTRVARDEDGNHVVEYRTAEGTTETLVADQVSICAATAAFGLAKQLDPAIEFPKLYLALREILYVDLPDGTDKTFTCLKLEDTYGGMLSPLNERCAMIYHPPAAHIMNLVMDPRTCEFPAKYAQHLEEGHPQVRARAEWTLDWLRDYYPELRRSTILGRYLKVAINTVADSRVRRNIGVFEVGSGATMTVLPKWTMCVVNARRELALALRHSVAGGNADADEAEAILADAMRTCWENPPAWAADQETLTAQAARHAANMRVPEVLAAPFSDSPVRTPLPLSG
jgi:glycine/D-amino acid oxidase-like deaminating enzyme